MLHCMSASLEIVLQASLARQNLSALECQMLSVCQILEVIGVIMEKGLVCEAT